MCRFNAEVPLNLLSRPELHRCQTQRQSLLGDNQTQFPNAACVVSLVDRLVHRVEVILVEGESCLVKEARQHVDAVARGEEIMKRLAHLPSGMTRGLDFLILENWSFELALAVVELIEDLHARIYDLTLNDLLRKQRSRPDDSNLNDIGNPFWLRPATPTEAVNGPSLLTVLVNRGPLWMCGSMPLSIAGKKCQET